MAAARVAQGPEPVPQHQALPFVVGPQSVATGRTEIEAGVELGAGQCRISTGGCYFGKEGVCIKRAGAGRDQDMLAQNVSGAGAAWVAVQLSGQHRFESRHALDDFEAVGGDQQGLGRGIVAMIGAANALHKAFHILGRTDLDDQIHIAPVDAQIKAAGTDDRPQIAAHHCRLDAFALGAVQRPVMDADGQAVIIRQPQVVKENLGLGAGVVENQRRFMLPDLIKDRRNSVGRATARPRRGLGSAQHLDVRGRAGIGEKDRAGVRVTCHEMRDGGRVFDGGRQANPFQIGAKRLQPRQRQHQLVATFAFCQGVDFIDHNPFETFEHARRVLVGGEEGQAFGGGQQDVGRVGTLATFARLRGVAGAVFDTDWQVHFGDRRCEIAFDIGG